MAIIYVDPTAPTGGDGSLGAPFNSWGSVVFVAGNSYLQKAGTTYAGSLVISAVATQGAPIILGAYGAGSQPMISGFVDFDGASYVSMLGFTVTESPYAAVTVQNGANHISIENNTLTRSAVGVWIGNAAGGSNTIASNEIFGNAGDGIAVSEVDNAPGSESAILNNTISDNGIHGIEIQGNRFIVTHNLIMNNGLTVSGASGIHTYAAGPTDGQGNDNIITNNIVLMTHDATGQDGNGIELDQWTSGNTVSGNFAAMNDGTGIVLYDSSANGIDNNVLVGNSVDPGHSHAMPGDLVINASLGLSAHNVLEGNTVYATRGRPAVNVDPVSTSDGNIFIANTYAQTGSGPVYDWGGIPGSRQSFWNEVASSTDTFASIKRISSQSLQIIEPSGIVLTIPAGVYGLISWPSLAGFAVTLRATHQ